MQDYVGIEIGGTKLQLLRANERGEIQEACRLGVKSAEGAGAIRTEIERILPRLLGPGRVAAIGVGFGGPVDWKTGRIRRSHQVEGWSEFDLGTWLKHLAGIPVFVDNDANVAALGEAARGAGTGCNPVFYVTLGSGVGGGLLVDGRIYHGQPPGEAEIGHVRLDRSGTIVENRCSGWAVDARIRELKSRHPDCPLARMLGEAVGGEARHLGPALDRQDPVAWQILRETAEDLAFALSHVTHLVHPEIIILGGGLSLVGEPLRAAVEAALPEFVMDAFGDGPRVALSGLGQDAVPVGALELARGRLHAQPCQKG
ncbi:MAG TPA: ROK family protein [Candidatus Paceibacterota bacterium]|nr:ROK family protein [Candidatus Paceibacterota bacterium]